MGKWIISYAPPIVKRRKVYDERFDRFTKSYEDKSEDLKAQIRQLTQRVTACKQDEEKLLNFIKVNRTYFEIQELILEIFPNI
jgi:hypothetical protein